MAALGNNKAKYDALWISFRFTSVSRRSLIEAAGSQFVGCGGSQPRMQYMGIGGVKLVAEV